MLDLDSNQLTALPDGLANLTGLTQLYPESVCGSRAQWVG
jgi:hypothetical protein